MLVKFYQKPEPSDKNPVAFSILPEGRGGVRREVLL